MTGSDHGEGIDLLQGAVTHLAPPIAGDSPGEKVDAAVLAAARRGDHAAFVAILRQHDPQLRALVCRLLGDRDEMDDVMQEAAIKAFRSLPGFREDAALGTWLYRLTYTTCVDHLRRRRDLDPLPASETASTEDDPAEIIGRRAAFAVLLSRLPDEQKAAVVLVDELELDYRTAAGILDVPVGTLASRLAAARATLRRALRPEPRPEEAP
jgi:RNA polymerase sigma-70 factor, ECF subfamily